MRKLPPADCIRLNRNSCISCVADVTKELVENALDAGAHVIEVCMRDRGYRELLVWDDGTGVGPERTEFQLLAEANATNKILRYSDSFYTQQYGFRGLALSWISNISDLSVYTRGGSSLEVWRARYINGGLLECVSIRPEDATVVIYSYLGHKDVDLSGTFTLLIVASLGNHLPYDIASQHQEVLEVVSRYALCHYKKRFRVRNGDTGVTLLDLKPWNEITPRIFELFPHLFRNTTSLTDKKKERRDKPHIHTVHSMLCLGPEVFGEISTRMPLGISLSSSSDQNMKMHAFDRPISTSKQTRSHSTEESFDLLSTSELEATEAIETREAIPKRFTSSPATSNTSLLRFSMGESHLNGRQGLATTHATGMEASLDSDEMISLSIALYLSTPPIRQEGPKNQPYRAASHVFLYMNKRPVIMQALLREVGRCVDKFFHGTTKPSFLLLLVRTKSHRLSIDVDGTPEKSIISLPIQVEHRLIERVIRLLCNLFMGPLQRPYQEYSISLDDLQKEKARLERVETQLQTCSYIDTSGIKDLDERIDTVLEQYTPFVSAMVRRSLDDAKKTLSPDFQLLQKINSCILLDTPSEKARKASLFPIFHISKGIQPNTSFDHKGASRHPIETEISTVFNEKLERRKTCITNDLLKRLYAPNPLRCSHLLIVRRRFKLEFIRRYLLGIRKSHPSESKGYTVPSPVARPRTLLSRSPSCSNASITSMRPEQSQDPYAYLEELATPNTTTLQRMLLLENRVIEVMETLLYKAVQSRALRNRRLFIDQPAIENDFFIERLQSKDDLEVGGVIRIEDTIFLYYRLGQSCCNVDALGITKKLLCALLLRHWLGNNYARIRNPLITIPRTSLYVVPPEYVSLIYAFHHLFLSLGFGLAISKDTKDPDGTSQCVVESLVHPLLLANQTYINFRLFFDTVLEATPTEQDFQRFLSRLNAYSHDPNDPTLLNVEIVHGHLNPIAGATDTADTALPNRRLIEYVIRLYSDFLAEPFANALYNTRLDSVVSAVFRVILDTLDLNDLETPYRVAILEDCITYP
ncbi:Mlh2-like protein [Giardia muris]|uniref:Mlh2-like protein n=1 Tax=Giardia muris TaxID=5742 RepID=A0A4Z1SVD9_GIAMU|nr:Mlh2-like protein [Giardia muris]|eukprot:TNJ29620.1 Mlh2-like protein [Giardia muris]